MPLYLPWRIRILRLHLKKRCPTSHSLCRAVLPDHRFVITSRGYASVVPHAGGKAHGVLIALTEPDEHTLDRYEHVHEGMYRRATVEVVTEFGYAVPALIYIDDIAGEGPPKPGYLERILEGARRHALPPEAIVEIEHWATMRKV